MHTEILLPDHAPAAYRSRAALWNAVEQVERAKNSQLAREIQLALPVELTREQNLSLVREYVTRHFVSAGMCADFAIHDTGKGNPHAHVMLTMRPIKPGGTWGDKQKKVYLLDKNGEKIYDPKKRQYKCNKVQTTDWNEHSKAEEWRKGWANAVNAELERQSHAARIDHRSFERQGLEQIPTIHLGCAAHQMEQKGIATDRGNINRAIEFANRTLRTIGAHILTLQNWLKEKLQAPQSALADRMEKVYDRQERLGYHGVPERRESAQYALEFMREYRVQDMAGLKEVVREKFRERDAVRQGMKPIEQRMEVLQEHLGQAEILEKHRPIYEQYKAQPDRNRDKFRAENRYALSRYGDAKRYFREALDKGEKVAAREWKAEYAALSAQYKEKARAYDVVKERAETAHKIYKTTFHFFQRYAPERVRDDIGAR